MKLGLRLRLVAAILPLFLAIGVLAVLGISGQMLMLSTALTAAIATLAIVLLTMPFERLQEATKEALRQAPGIDHDNVAVSMKGRSLDGTGEIANTVWVLLDLLTQSHAQLTERDKQYSETLDRVTKYLTDLAEETRKSASPLQISSPWADRSQLMQSAVEQIGRSLAYSIRRMQTYNAILNEIPNGVIVCDEKMNIAYLNTTAGRIFPHVSLAAKSQLGQCFGQHSADPSNDPDMPTAIECAQVLEWIAKPQAGQCIAKLNDDQFTLVAIRKLVTPVSKYLKGYKVLEVRDITSEVEEGRAARQRHRRDVGHRLSLLMNTEATPALEAVRTQAALLAQTAKQAGQRDRFLPKVSRLLEDLSRQETVVTLLGWLGQMYKTQNSVQDTVEIRLRDVADGVVEKLLPMYSERTNTLEIKGDAGWLVADEDWITVLITGLLMHANRAVEQKPVRLELGRRSEAVGRKELCELAVRYAGPPIPEQLAADVQEPFGRMNSTALAPSGPGGFPLGLAVTARVAKLMGGELHFDHANGEVCLRTVLPTRAIDTPAPRMSIVDVNSEPPEFEGTDMLGGWAIGGKVVPTHKESEQADPNMTGRYEAPIENDISEPVLIDDTVGNWFGSSK